MKELCELSPWEHGGSEWESLPYSHTSGKWPGQDSNPDPSDSRMVSYVHVCISQLDLVLPDRGLKQEE